MKTHDPDFWPLNSHTGMHTHENTCGALVNTHTHMHNVLNSGPTADSGEFEVRFLQSPGPGDSKDAATREWE